MIWLLLKGAAVTLEISLLAITFGFIAGTLLALLIQRGWSFLKLYVWVMRGTPLFVQLLIIYFALPFELSPFAAGVIALGLNSTAYLCEVMRAGLMSIPEDQWEAATMLGYSRPQTLRFVILPQALKTMMPPLTNEMISLVKESSILMVIGVAELTKVSREIVARELNPMEVYLVAAAIYLAITTLLTWGAKQCQS